MCDAYIHYIDNWWAAKNRKFSSQGKDLSLHQSWLCLAPKKWNWKKDGFGFVQSESGIAYIMTKPFFFYSTIFFITHLCCHDLCKIQTLKWKPVMYYFIIASVCVLWFIQNTTQFCYKLSKAGSVQFKFKIPKYIWNVFSDNDCVDLLECASIMSDPI